MSVASKRLQFMRAQAAAAHSRSGLPAFKQVDHELQELSRSKKVSPQHRQHLLQVFHGMRALETAIKEVVRSHGLIPNNSLGKLLHQMNALPSHHAAHLSVKDLNRFLKTVRHERNRIMHEANAFPRSAREADIMMGEVASCFALLVQ